MKLTNRHLDIIIAAINNRVQAKRKEILSNLTVEKEEEILVSLGYNSAMEINSTIEEISEKIDSLNKKKRDLESSFKKLFPDYGKFTQVRKDWVENFFKNQMEKEAIKDLPTTQELEQEVVLASMEGSGDLIKRILTKFNLEENV